MSEEVKTNEDINEEVQTEETAAADTAVDTAASAEDKPEGAAQPAPYQRRPQGSGDGAERGQFQRNTRFKRKVCKFCYDKNLAMDYKNSKLLEQFITDRGKILPRRVTGTCAKHQRGVALAIKRARIIALIPFVEQ